MHNKNLTCFQPILTVNAEALTQQRETEAKAKQQIQNFWVAARQKHEGMELHNKFLEKLVH